MLFLVRAKIGNFSRDQASAAVEISVAVERLASEGRVKAYGKLLGAREAIAIVEAESNAAIGAMLATLPMHSCFASVDVQPLVAPQVVLRRYASERRSPAAA